MFSSKLSNVFLSAQKEPTPFSSATMIGNCVYQGNSALNMLFFMACADAAAAKF